MQHLGKDYAGGPEKFRQKCHDAFLKNSQETDPKKIEVMIRRGEYMIREMEALNTIKKFRAMKQRYYDKDKD